MTFKAATAETTKAIGARVRAARLMSGLSQERLADKIGVTFQQVQKYEKGANRISAAGLHSIATAVGVPVMALMAPDTEGAAPDPIAHLLTTENMRLIQAFSGIDDPKVRTRVLGLVESLGLRLGA